MNLLNSEILLPEMERVEEGLFQYIKTASRDLNHLSSLLLKRPAKRFRPLLVMLASSFYPAQEETRIQVATAVELIHTASLIHDDVIDEASLRRGGDTINSRWDNKVAVLTGDHLFARAFQLLTRQKNHRLLPVMTRTISLMCSGEVEQLLQNGMFRGEEEYLDQVQKKTASLLAASCSLGGMISAMPQEEVDQLHRYGLYLGYGFQIIDDIFDVRGTKKLGKPIGSDIQEGIFTLPLIYLLEDKRYGPSVTDLLEKGGLQPPIIKYISAALEETGAIERAHQKALGFITQAQKELEGLPPVPAREILHELAMYVVDRDY